MSDGNNLSFVGSSNVDVPNGVWEDIFHVEGILINMPYVCVGLFEFTSFSSSANNLFIIVLHMLMRQLSCVMKY